MKFEEDNFIDLTNVPLVFVYLLTLKDEVVYVGQTTKGLSRCYHHIFHSEKVFDNIQVFPCDEVDLDYFESFYIIKYNPIYNKILDNPGIFKLNSVVPRINKMLTTKKPITNKKLSNIMQTLHIIPIQFRDKQYLYKHTLTQIVNYIEKEDTL